MARSRTKSPLDDLLADVPPRVAVERLARPEPALATALTEAGVDRSRLIIDVWEGRLQRTDRRRNGVFYTPDAVVVAMLDRIRIDGEILDPAVGAGAFVLALVRRIGPSLLDRLSVCDVDADALDACAFALEAELGPEHRARIEQWRRTRAHVVDFLRDPWPGPAPALIVGNPPYRLATDDTLASRFPVLRGEIDLYACFLVRALEVVASQGTVALLVPDSWLTNTRDEGLRTHLLGHGLARLVDFGKPFASAPDTRVHAVVLEGGTEKVAVESVRGGALAPMATARHETLRDRVGRGWCPYRTDAEERACAAIERAPRLSERFDVIYGLRTGNNAKHVSSGPGATPLVGGADLDAFDRVPSSKHLVTPEAFARALANQRGRWKIGIQRIRTNSRLPWRRWLEGALLSQGEIGLDSLTLVAPRERDAEPSDALLCALGAINSSVLNRWYRLSFTDVNVKPAYIVDLPMPDADPVLAALVRRRLMEPGNLILERAIDRLVAVAFGLDDEALQTLERDFWEAELAVRPMPTMDEARLLAK